MNCLHFAFNRPLTYDQELELILKASWEWVCFELSYAVIVQSIFNKHPTEEEKKAMATHSSTLA